MIVIYWFSFVPEKISEVDTDRMTVYLFIPRSEIHFEEEFILIIKLRIAVNVNWNKIQITSKSRTQKINSPFTLFEE